MTLPQASAEAENKPILVFTGPIGVGKTTIVTDWMRTYVGWKSISFADPLRRVISLVYGIPESIQKEPSAKAKSWPQLGGRTLRYALQFLGTECFRTLYDPTWLEAWGRTYKELCRDPEITGVLVEDLRFVNEFELLNECDALFIVIDREPNSSKWKALVESSMTAANKWKGRAIKALPFLRKFIRPIEVHESERQIYEVLQRIEGLPAHRVLHINNSGHGGIDTIIVQITQWLKANREAQ